LKNFVQDNKKNLTDFENLLGLICSQKGNSNPNYPEVSGLIETEINFVKVLNFDKVIEVKSRNYSRSFGTEKSQTVRF
jgi:hypothetical protein